MTVLHFPLYLCSITGMSWWKHSPCLLLTSPQFNGKKSRCENEKYIFSNILHPSCSYKSIRSCTSSLKFTALKFPRKPFETFSEDCHVALSLSLNTASNCWSLWTVPHMHRIHQTISVFALGEITYSSKELSSALFFGSSRSLMRSLSSPCVILWLGEYVLGK